MSEFIGYTDCDLCGEEVSVFTKQGVGPHWECKNQKESETCGGWGITNIEDIRKDTG